MPNGTPETQYHANGIDPDGKYLQPPVPETLLADVAVGDPIDPGALATLRERYETKDTASFGVIGDRTSLADVGWGVLFAYEDKDRIQDLKRALAPLLERRKAQAGSRYYELDASRAYRAGESKTQFLKRFNLGPGTVDPAKLPYYLLIVGDPRQISFRFQYLLDVQFAVGRIHFDAESDQEALDKYARYAKSVVEAEEKAEQKTLELPKKVVLFGPQNEGDKATELSVRELIVPLAEELRHEGPAGWTIVDTVEDDASKAALRALVGGSAAPAFLFTASHGLGLKPDAERLFTHQGALVCSSWAGPGSKVNDGDIFAAGDVDPDGSLLGRIAFHFACFGAGTPKLDDFSTAVGGTAIAPYDFVARLPQAMLSHPGGGALAVVGHVDRAWDWSFHWGTAGAQRAVFRKAIGDLLAGLPVGVALDEFSLRYSEISTLLTEEIADVKAGKTRDDALLAGYWTANSDARNYVLLGDPAVRLSTA